eukprot:scaffold276179_cov44-Prasinocladus_malaysianus.AAC.1
MLHDEPFTDLCNSPLGVSDGHVKIHDNSCVGALGDGFNELSACRYPRRVELGFGAGQLRGLADELLDAQLSGGAVAGDKHLHGLRTSLGRLKELK